eukprot:CAMPEP_0201880148 /NCGR_PEP_ID=MMETSP0902-20130614/10835_1 /ASSEMBLY_ACC=CAM_ASM_000551 /TAXON_ID=420261 /ORGANISM="Thalassiosira antarctica, Strain CCMP982" /LENGTH=939 /DNA_ID=CAMNT_0048408125 /DNA_START=8 /DNA_END=2827 /DNA_ORIENTATION=+
MRRPPIQEHCDTEKPMVEIRMSNSKSILLLCCCVLLISGPCSAFQYQLPRINPESMLKKAGLHHRSSATIKGRLSHTTSSSHGTISTSSEQYQSSATAIYMSKQLDSSIEKSPKSSNAEKSPRSSNTEKSLKSSNKEKSPRSSTKEKSPKSSNKEKSPKSFNKKKKPFKKGRKKYARKLPVSPSEKAVALNRRNRRAAYEKLRTTSMETTNEPPSVWSFDALFPAPVLDGKSIREDLYGNKEREEEMRVRQLELNQMREQKRLELEKQEKDYLVEPSSDETTAKSREEDLDLTRQTIMKNVKETDVYDYDSSNPTSKEESEEKQPVDKTLTRLVQDRISGLWRSPAGSIQYSTSLLDSDKAVQFREGIRLGKPLTINIDRLCHFSKKEMRHGRLEEAQENYLKALELDPTDGRPYLGLSRIAQRRGDLKHARGLLKEGISKSTGGYVVVKGATSTTENEKKNKGKNKNDYDSEEQGKTIGHIPDLGPNPFLLQALGTLEQKSGNFATAEELYLQGIRSRPSHAASWVSLAQLRTKELRQGASAGRACYQSAERELTRVGAKQNSFVYTAWASMEYKKGGRNDDTKSLRRARELYQKALNVDPNCSVAYLQLGVMESECGNFDTAQECFDTVLKFDQRNSRVLQAYAIMESRRVHREDVDSRRVLDLFERALKANPRDAGVYQAYALYLVELGDVDSARNFLRRGTAVDKRHAPVWQAWGVLESRYSTAKIARDVFQQGIWACAQPGGGQSGGRRCARLWQAWGVLEAQEGDHSAARRCFSRALDADQRNVAALTAWTLMEADLGNFADARSIFERSLKLFTSPSVDKTAIWRAYEVMEERGGNTRRAQLVFQRSMGEVMASTREEITPENPSTEAEDLFTAAAASKSKYSKKREVEVSRWDTGSNELDSEVWMNNGSIESKVPASMMKKLKNRQGEQKQ